MNWFSEHAMAIAAVAGVITLLTLGAAKLIPGAKSSTPLMWVAWVTYAACGLILGWALSSVVTWLTSGTGTLGVIVAIPAVLAGWHAVYLIVALVRDLADKRPDEDARKAALWVPTLLPAGIQAVLATVTHPRGVVNDIIAVTIAVITIVYAHRIVAAALAGKKGRKGWAWFAAAVCLLAGLMTAPLMLYTDGIVSNLLAGSDWVPAIRVVAGLTGVALLVAAVADLKDRVPDQNVRSFLAYGLPLLLAFGGIAVTTGVTAASDGGQILTGSLR